MEIKEVVIKFKEKPNYLSYGAGKLAKAFNCSVSDIYEARMIIRKKHEKDLLEKRVLVIGDTHLPYEKEGYLEFCKEQYDKYDCNEVVHIGDIIDLHATSFHPSVPEAYSAGDELKYTKLKLKDWYKTFPDMKVVRGNHDDRVFRLAASVGVPSTWIKDFTEVLDVPNWTFRESYEINDVIYVHGTGTSGATAAYKRALNAGKSVVIGHLHTESSIMYHRLPNKTIFGMIVGCGIDEDGYGMNYAKNMPKKSIISCGVILGNQPIIIPME